MPADRDKYFIRFAPHALLAASGTGQLVVETPLSESRLALPAGADAHAFVRMLGAAVKRERQYGDLVRNCDRGSRQLIDWLVAHGFVQLVEKAPPAPEREEGWRGLFRALGGDWQVDSATAWGFPHDANQAMDRVRNADVVIYGSGLVARRLLDEMKATGCRHLRSVHGDAATVAPLLGDVDLLLFAGVPGDSLSATEINRLCARHGTPWLGIALHMNRVEVGPLCVPGESPCLACLEGELADGFGRQFVDDPEQHLPHALPGVEIMVLEACRFLAGLETNTYSRIWRWLLGSYRTEWLELRKNPACAVCGPEREQEEGDRHAHGT